MKKFQKHLTKKNITIATVSVVFIGLLMHLGGINYLKDIFGSRAGGNVVALEPGEEPKDISQFKEKDGCRKFYPWGAPNVNDDTINARSLYMCRSSYGIQYDTKLKMPLWSIEMLQRSNVVSFNIPASFVPTQDPDLPNKMQPLLSDYTNSGYEFGYLHSVKNAYLHSDSFSLEQLEEINRKSLKESFYITNAVPQSKAAKQMSEVIIDDARKLIAEKSPLYIISGPVFFNGKTNGEIGVGEDKIPVPTHIFKIVTYPHTHGSVAYIIPNDKNMNCADGCSAANYRTSIREVEKVTGIVFYPELANFYAVQVKQDINEIFRKHK